MQNEPLINYDKEIIDVQNWKDSDSFNIKY